MIEKIECTLVGISPLLMHNGELANPLAPSAQAVKSIAKKRNKTEEDHERLRHVEWLGSLYLDMNRQLCIPAENVLKLCVVGAQRSKLGKDAQAGVFETEPFYPLIYDGPRDLQMLYETPGFVDYRSVVVSGRRIMRSRARFATWSLPIQLQVATDIIDVKSVMAALVVAGERVGLGDGRPRFGRFVVE